MGGAHRGVAPAPQVLHELVHVEEDPLGVDGSVDRCALLESVVAQGRHLRYLQSANIGVRSVHSWPF